MRALSLAKSVFAAGVLTFAVTAAAQSFPTRPVRIIIPTSAGTSPDIVSRLLAEYLSPRLGQPVIVDPRPGAGGKIGLEATARAPADGHTLGIGSRDWQGVFANLYPTWEVNPVRDFAPVSLLIRVPIVLTASPSVPAANLQGLIEHARSNQGMTFGTPGIGTIVHVVAELLSHQEKLGLVHVPYRNFAEAMPAAVRGDLKLIMSGAPPVLGYVRDGRLKAIAATGATRSKLLPDVPTFAEGGVRGFEEGAWFGLIAPAATPKEVIARLNREVVEIGRLPEYTQRVEKLFAEPVTSSPEAMARLISADVATLGAVIRQANIKVD
jgi:tripartite-type tricarboxylate transporter receptor subunit TctC